MKFRIFFCLFLTLMAVMSSCLTVEKVMYINVQKPASVTLPSYIQNITIVNNAITQPDSINHKNLMQDIAIAADSINTTLTNALAQFMDDEQFYNQVLAYKEPLRKDGFFLTESDINRDDIRRIADETNADAIISLDRFVVQLSTLYYADVAADMWNKFECYDLNGFTPYDPQLFIIANLQVKLKTYDLNGNTIQPFLYRDTLCFRANRSIDLLVNLKEALRQSAIQTADYVASVFAPHWQEQQRTWFYDSQGAEMREAAQKAMDNNWKDAALVWGKIFETEDNAEKKARLAANIALANEMLDDVENALTWAIISYGLYIEAGQLPHYIATYCEELKSRLADFKKLDEQKRELE